MLAGARGRVDSCHALQALLSRLQRLVMAVCWPAVRGSGRDGRGPEVLLQKLSGCMLAPWIEAGRK